MGAHALGAERVRRTAWPAALVALLAVSALGPLALLVVTSLARGWFFPALWPDAWTLDAWRSLLRSGARLAGAGGTSLALGAGTAALALLVAFPAGRALAGMHGWRRHAGAAAAFLPAVAPPIALAVGLQTLFLRLGVGGTFPGVLLAHTVPAAGYVTLYFLGVFLTYDDRLEEQARTLGARPSAVFLRVTLPVLRGPLVDGLALGFLISWAQVPLTLLIGGGAVRTLPVEVFGYLQAGQDRFAAAGALLLVVPGLLLLAAAALGVRRTAAVAA